jgi:hypothetical protein
MVYSGYSLTLISATSTRQLINYYNVELPQQTVLSLLNGILPVGAILGSLLLPHVMPLTNKKYIPLDSGKYTIFYCPSQ